MNLEEQEDSSVVRLIGDSQPLSVLKVFCPRRDDNIHEYWWLECGGQEKKGLTSTEARGRWWWRTTPSLFWWWSPSSHTDTAKARGDES